MAIRRRTSDTPVRGHTPGKQGYKPCLCVPRPDQRSNVSPKYFWGRVLCLYLPTLGQREIFRHFVATHSLHLLFHSSWRNFGQLQSFAGCPEASASAPSSSAPSGITTHQPGWFASRCKVLRSIVISAKWRASQRFSSSHRLLFSRQR